MATLPSSEPGASVGTAAGQMPGPTSRFQRLLKWAEVMALIATVAGLISSALYFFVAARGLDLVVWLEKVQRVYPSAETDNLPLPLAFQNEPALAVTMVKVNVSNLGDGAIGSQENLWQLTLTEPKASRLELVGSLERSSDRIQLMEIPQPARNAYSVRIGVLERRAGVEFWLMAIHDPAVRVRPTVSTSLAGLPRPETTEDPLYARLGAKLTPFMIPLSALGFLYIAVKDLRERSTGLRQARDLMQEMQEQRRKQDLEGVSVDDDQYVSDDKLARVHRIVQHWEARDWRSSRWAMARALAGNGAGIVIGAAMLGGFSANVLGWIMTWFV